MNYLAKPLLAAILALASWNANAQLCTAAASSISFGTYNPQSSANVDNAGTITVTCQAILASLLIAYNVQLSAGSSGSFSQRKMLNGTNTMNYQVYSNGTHTTVWGDGTASTSYITDGYLLQLIGPVSKTYQVYGRIPGSQNVQAGTYIDTLTILITY